MNKKNPIIVRLIRIIVKKRVIRTLILTSISVATAMACGWSYITDHSVRFNSYRTGRAFYRLPPLPIMFDRKTGKEPGIYGTYIRFLFAALGMEGRASQIVKVQPFATVG